MKTRTAKKAPAKSIASRYSLRTSVKQIKAEEGTRRDILEDAADILEGTTEDSEPKFSEYVEGAGCESGSHPENDTGSNSEPDSETDKLPDTELMAAFGRKPREYPEPEDPDSESEGDADSDREEDTDSEENEDSGSGEDSENENDTESDGDEAMPSDSKGLLESSSRSQFVDLCPVCGGKWHYPVETNCHHVFCAECFISSWRKKGYAWTSPLPCNVCRKLVKSVLPRFQEPTEPEDLQLKNGLLYNINDYNGKFSSEPRIWLEYGTEPARGQPVPSFRCPICRRESCYPVESGCGHVVCGRCLVQYWRCVKICFQLRCILCGKATTVLTPRFAAPTSTEDLAQRNGVTWHANDYNIQFSDSPNKLPLECSSEVWTAFAGGDACPACSRPVEAPLAVPQCQLCPNCLMQFWRNSAGYGYSVAVLLPRVREQREAGGRQDDSVPEDSLRGSDERKVALRFKMVHL